MLILFRSDIDLPSPSELMNDDTQLYNELQQFTDIFAHIGVNDGFVQQRLQEFEDLIEFGKMPSFHDFKQQATWSNIDATFNFSHLRPSEMISLQTLMDCANLLAALSPHSIYVLNNTFPNNRRKMRMAIKMIQLSDFILRPLYLEGHFVTIVHAFSLRYKLQVGRKRMRLSGLDGKLWNSTIYVLDSLQTPDRDTSMTKYADAYLHEFNRETGNRFGFFDYNVICVSNFPQQEDGINCGVFSFWFMWNFCLMENYAVDFYAINLETMKVLGRQLSPFRELQMLPTRMMLTMRKWMWILQYVVMEDGFVYKYFRDQSRTYELDDFAGASDNDDDMHPYKKITIDILEE